MLASRVRRAIAESLNELFPQTADDPPPIEVELPRDRSHGDYASNVAMLLAKPLRSNPREIAGRLAEHLGTRTELFAAVEVAGPGFLNFRIAPACLIEGLASILEQGAGFGRSGAGENRPVQVEYVSANPTGPLNVVNARAAAFGGALVRLLTAAGYAARSEFYVNDVGRQIDLLGESLAARLAQSRGETAELPEDGYQGEYLAGLADSLIEERTSLPAADDPEFNAKLSGIAVERILSWQERDLRAYGTTFDRWYRQSELYPERVQWALKLFQDRGHTEERDGAQWFRATEFGDDQDRVLVRSNGEPTYFLADLAYHADKHERGFERAIDIWGPDHHGYIPRMQSGMEALGYGRDWLEVLIVQQVNLLSGGEPVKMSKRKGEFITLQDLLDDVGKDTAVFFFLMRRAESHLDFDLDLARAQSDENPVFYVKYAHARISGVLRKAEEEGAPEVEGADLGRLVEEPELNLIKTLLRFPGVVVSAAEEREPHRLTNYLREVAQAFHFFYHHCRVVSDDRDLTRARLALTRAARLGIANGLALMDIEAPERM